MSQTRLLKKYLYVRYSRADGR